jgi:TP901 family phage tail tape measure protein
MSRGTDEDTAKGLAELSILAQSAGDMTADLANSYIVATNAAYKLGNNVTQLNAILDGQNQITNRNQVSMSDLAEATKVAGSQAAQSGVAVNEMTAAMGTMIASTKQGGDIAGRAFKGILMNLQQVSGEIDGEVFNEDSFKKVEETLNDVGVATEEIVNGTAKLRDPIEILKELAKVYNSLPSDSVDKANIISDLGGKLYHVMQKCITRIYLIAGNPLEPYTTI